MKRFFGRWAIGLPVIALVVMACGGGSGAGSSTTSATNDSTTTTTVVEETTTTAATEPVSLSFLIDDNQVTIDSAEALAAAFTAANPNVTFEIETRPGGGEGDNIVKTRLATGEMTDIFWYNTGSLFQALNPTETLVPVTDEPFVGNIVESFLPTVTAGDNVYGVPSQTAMGGGVLYNKAIYEDLGLSVPTNWDEFAANNEAILAAGIAPVGQTYSDTWTSQLFVLADFYNVQAAGPGLGRRLHQQSGKVRRPTSVGGFRTSPAGFRGRLVSAGFRLDDLRRRAQPVGNRRDRALPDAHVCPRGHR